MTNAIITTKYGEIEIEFFDEITNTVKNFVSLAKKGFYDGTTFHRCIPGFVAQGGDPYSKTREGSIGTGGPGYQIPCETEKNSGKLNHRHVRGVISMAHAGRNTGGSQFFIVRNPQPHLDGNHTVFGRVVKGLEIIDKLEDGDKMIKVAIDTISPLIENHQLIKI